MFTLKLLHEFKLIIKMDLDVTLLRPMVFNLEREMEGKAFAHTAKFCSGLFACSSGIAKAKAEFTKLSDDGRR